MMKIRHILSFLTLVLLAVTGGIANARDYKLTSPDGQVAVTVSVGDSLTWTVSRAGELLLKPSPIGMDIRDLSRGKCGYIWSASGVRMNCMCLSKILV